MAKQKNFKKHSKPIKLEKFYKSNAWHKARLVVINREHGLCQRCGAPGTQVHHKIHLTLANVDDPKIALNPDNLELLCDSCHNEVHHRFSGRSQYKFDEEGNLIKK